jgi:hypothetical protein
MFNVPGIADESASFILELVSAGSQDLVDDEGAFP